MKHKDPNRKKAAPYNAYVQKERLQKYYERKKTYNKFKRLQKYEGRQQSGTADSYGSIIDRVVNEGAEALDAEFEQRLAFSFGGEESHAPKKKIIKRKRKLKVTTSKMADDAEPPAQKVAKKQKEGIASGIPSGEADGNERSRKKTKSKAQSSDAAEIPLKQAALGRFSKELRQHHKAMEDADAERKKREEEMQSRNRKRKETAKGRAVKGNLLSHCNRKGQPNMQSLLEAVTKKLEGNRK